MGEKPHKKLLLEYPCRSRLCWLVAPLTQTPLLPSRALAGRLAGGAIGLHAMLGAPLTCVPVTGTLLRFTSRRPPPSFCAPPHQAFSSQSRDMSTAWHAVQHPTHATSSRQQLRSPGRLLSLALTSVPTAANGPLERLHRPLSRTSNVWVFRVREGGDLHRCARKRRALRRSLRNGARCRRSLRNGARWSGRCASAIDGIPRCGNTKRCERRGTHLRPDRGDGVLGVDRLRHGSQGVAGHEVHVGNLVIKRLHREGTRARREGRRTRARHART
jgi:hypothetical protein